MIEIILSASIITVIVQLIKALANKKKIKLSDEEIPFIAIAIGILYVYAIIPDSSFSNIILKGAIIGLGAIGIYSGQKNVRGK